MQESLRERRKRATELPSRAAILGLVAISCYFSPELEGSYLNRSSTAGCRKGCLWEQLLVAAVPKGVRALPSAPAPLDRVAHKVWSVFTDSASTDPRTASVFCRIKTLWVLFLRAGSSHFEHRAEQGLLSFIHPAKVSLPVPQHK